MSEKLNKKIRQCNFVQSWSNLQLLPMLCEATMMIEIVQFSVLGIAFSDASSSMKLLCPTLSPFLKLLR